MVRTKIFVFKLYTKHASPIYLTILHIKAKIFRYIISKILTIKYIGHLFVVIIKSLNTVFFNIIMCWCV